MIAVGCTLQSPASRRHANSTIGKPRQTSSTGDIEISRDIEQPPTTTASFQRRNAVTAVANTPKETVPTAPVDTLQSNDALPTQAAEPYGTSALDHTHIIPAVIDTRAQPIRLEIPRIQVDAAIERVGLDAAGAMEAPEYAANVAWYSPGPPPGEPGHATIVGHLDDRRARPAVFWRLNELLPGDDVIIQTRTGRSLYFSVLGQESYAADQLPLDQLFSTTDQITLNLITCSGTWDPTKHMYPHRRVVYTVLAADRSHDR